MRGYLLDTNAISLLAPKSGTPAVAADFGPFAAWIRAHGDELFISSVTVAEIQAGISGLERKGAHRRAGHLSHWLSAIVELYDNRTLALDTPVALETGRLLERAKANGNDPGFEDAAIAATAAVHELTVVTANIRHFEHFGVPIMLPPSGAALSL